MKKIIFEQMEQVSGGKNGAAWLTIGCAASRGLLFFGPIGALAAMVMGAACSLTFLMAAGYELSK